METQGFQMILTKKGSFDLHMGRCGNKRLQLKVLLVIFPQRRFHGNAILEEKFPYPQSTNKINLHKDLDHDYGLK